jgi:predicted ATP-grasp superfamily ATP-dependent carboligase
VSVANLRDENQVIETLLNVANRLGLHRWVLYPTREELVAAISRNRSRLSDSFRVPTPEWDSVKWAWDKRNTYKLASELGIPTPTTHYPLGTEELAALDGLEPPFVIKPAIKEHFIYTTKAKAWRADSHAELKELFRSASELVGAGEVMVQELIPGGGMQQFAFCAFFRNGQAIGKMVVRRRRQFPYQFGRSSTYVETVDIPILEDYSTRFLRASNYYGLVEMEFKLDPRDGQYKLLDVNARTWGYHSLGARSGVDFSHMLYEDQMGRPVSSSQSKPGIAWVRMTTDLPATFFGLLAGDTNPISYLQSIMRCKVEAAFSRKDPIPGIVEVLMVPYLAFKKGF